MKICIDCNSTFMTEYCVECIKEVKSFIWRVNHTKYRANNKYAQKRKKEQIEMMETIKKLKNDLE